jgi:hypothetical protein
VGAAAQAPAETQQEIVIVTRCLDDCVKLSVVHS